VAQRVPHAVRLMMSALGEKQMCNAQADVRFVPKADINGLRRGSTQLQLLHAIGPRDLTVASCIAQQVKSANRAGLRADTALT